MAFAAKGCENVSKPNVQRGGGGGGVVDYSGCTSPGSFLGLGLGQTLNSVRAKT